MPDSIWIDSELLEQALAVSGETTAADVVARALREFIARREPARVRELFGTLDWDPEYDPKAERSRD